MRSFTKSEGSDMSMGMGGWVGASYHGDEGPGWDDEGQNDEEQNDEEKHIPSTPLTEEEKVRIKRNERIECVVGCIVLLIVVSLLIIFAPIVWKNVWKNLTKYQGTMTLEMAGHPGVVHPCKGVDKNKNTEDLDKEDLIRIIRNDIKDPVRSYYIGRSKLIIIKVFTDYKTECAERKNNLTDKWLLDSGYILKYVKDGEQETIEWTQKDGKFSHLCGKVEKLN